MALQDMVDAAPEEIAAIEDSLIQIDEQKALHQQKITDLNDEMMTPSVAALDAKLLTKVPPDYDYPNPDYPTEGHDTIYVTYNLVYGGTFETDNITDWVITEHINDGTDSSTTDIYRYEGVGWDSDAEIIQAIATWDFAYDYINAELGVATGAYGLLALITALDQGITVLNANKTTLENLLLVTALG